MRRLAAAGLALYAFTIPFQRSFAFDVGSPATVAGAMAAFFGLLAMLAGPRRQPLHPAVGLAAVLVAIIIFNLGWAPLPTELSNPAIRGLAGADAAKVLQLLVILWLCWEFIDGRREALQLAAAYVLGAHIATAYSIWEWADKGLLADRIAGGEAAQPNVVAMSLTIGLPLAWWAVHRLENRLLRLIMLAYLITGPVGILLTGSRTGFAAMVLAYFTVALTFRRVSVSWKAGVLVAAAIGALILPTVLDSSASERALTVFDAEEGRDLEVRSELFELAWDAIGEYPLGGAGRGVVRQERALVAPTGNEYSSHNSFLNIGAEYGLIAMAIFAAMWVLALVSTLRAKGFDRAIALSIWLIAVGGGQVINFDLEKANWMALALVLVVARAPAQATPPVAERAEPDPDSIDPPAALVSA